MNKKTIKKKDDQNKANYMQVRTEFVTINKGGWAEDGEEEKDVYCLAFAWGLIEVLIQFWALPLSKPILSNIGNKARIKGVSFEKNCGAASVGEYNRVI